MSKYSLAQARTGKLGSVDVGLALRGPPKGWHHQNTVHYGLPGRCCLGQPSSIVQQAALPTRQV